MRVVAKISRECVLCTAMKKYFCPALPSPYSLECPEKVNQMASGAIDDVDFTLWLSKVPLADLARAQSEYLAHLSEAVEEIEEEAVGRKGEERKEPLPDGGARPPTPIPMESAMEEVPAEEEAAPEEESMEEGELEATAEGAEWAAGA
ncbi:MAG: hypothetical protein ACP5RJ_08255 [Conexivisphaera sp.]